MWVLGRERYLRDLKKAGLGLGHGGIWGLAVEGGECGQKHEDKKRGWDCTRGLKREARGLGRGLSSGGGW
jgi:hypothetical protein